MGVSVVRASLVKPYEPTWTGTQFLSEWDQVGVISHVSTIYVYKPSQDYLNITTSLKESLSKALVHFYPLAGRVHFTDGSRLVLHCNAMGAEVIESESDLELADFGDFSPSAELDLLFPSINYEKPIQEIPLLVVQITRFRGDGFSLSVSFSHAIADGQSCLHFLSEWARLARGENLGHVPYLDREVIRAGKPSSDSSGLDVSQFHHPPLLVGQTSNHEEREKEFTVATLKLSNDQVGMLKCRANQGGFASANARAYTRYETITAHIWRCACKARNHLPTQLTGLGVCVDVRKRTNPPLPDKYFGNAVLTIPATNVAEMIMTSPLGFVCSQIREAIERVDSEYVTREIEFFKSQKDLCSYQIWGTKGPFYGNPNLHVTSWLSLPLFNLNFGWGKEIYMGPGNDDSEGSVLIMPSYNDDGSVVVIGCFQINHMNAFKKFFYENI